MTIAGFEELLAVAGLIAAVGFAVSARRHDLACKQLDTYRSEFDALTRDESVSVELLQNMHDVFVLSCRYCAGVSLLAIMVRYRYDDEYRQKINVGSAPGVKNLRVDTSRSIIRTYEALFTYASYSIPFFGWIVRRIIRSASKVARADKKPAVFLFAAKRALHVH
jgi:hypothetical protein